MIIWSKIAQLGLKESSEVEGFKLCVSGLGGSFWTNKNRRSRG